jgi:hypothetical protein
MNVFGYGFNFFDDGTLPHQEPNPSSVKYTLHFIGLNLIGGK